MKLYKYTAPRAGLDEEEVERLVAAMKEIRDVGRSGGLFCVGLVMVQESPDGLERVAWDFCKEGFEPMLSQSHLERALSFCLENLLEMEE